jgi:hypothetical protein
VDTLPMSGQGLTSSNLVEYNEIPSFKPRLGGDRSASRNAVASEPNR